LEKRSRRVVVHKTLDVKSWVADQPSVEAARPHRCPACKVPSRPQGEALKVWGHGSHERTILGPPDPSGAPTQRVVRVRRYFCRACDVSVTVAPAGIVPGYRYGAGAIMLGFVLWGLLMQPPGKVRSTVSPWATIGPSQQGLWRSLTRWVLGVTAGRLFRGLLLGSGLGPGPPRAIAAQVAQIASGHGAPGDPSGDVRQQACRGALAIV